MSGVCVVSGGLHPCAGHVQRTMAQPHPSTRSLSSVLVLTDTDAAVFAETVCPEALDRGGAEISFSHDHLFGE